MAILGSTGSIGTQALEVIAANRDRFTVVALAATDAARPPCDVVLNGMTGAVGLMPTLAALEEGTTLALANKESLIIGGEIVMGAAKSGQLVPVDSEHSALAQAMRGERVEDVQAPLDGRRLLTITRSTSGRVKWRPIRPVRRNAR